jgi:acetyltransferase-like isoleucine patch superfamily enzyme
MKTEFKDYLISTLAIFLILLITLFLINFTTLLISSHFGELSLLVNVLLFFLFYGLTTALYFRILDKFFPCKEGTYEMNHSQFTLWKHYGVVGELGKLTLKLFFPVFFKPIFYSLLGAKIGKNVAIGGVITDPMLTKIEDNAVLGQDSVVTSHTMVFNVFFLKPVIIRKGATVGINAVIMPGVEVGENSIVAPGAVVEMNTKIPPNEFWGGVPARKIKDVETSSK